jgi:tRNA (adenine57-N1/adenine58-N1)-methyltransferase catalytic subunit
LPHRTQILYNPDISLILTKLVVKPGVKVGNYYFIIKLVEAGTGSGSLSTHFIKTVHPNGHLYTFEFHKERCEQARKEFLMNGLNENVTVTFRDVVKDGFKLESEKQLDDEVDAIFLDLPKPWEVICHTEKVLKKGGRFCSFSPCIEQVQNTCEELRKSKFTCKI